MMRRIGWILGLALLSITPAPGTADAQSSYPVQILSPASGFTSTGSLQLTVWVAKGFYDQVQVPTAAEATLTVSVDGCANIYTYRISDSGVVTPIRLNPRSNSISGYHWTVDVDLSACQCHAENTRFHHCDGCGRTFDTCSGAGEGCEPRTVSVTLEATNRAGNSVCDGALCGALTGVLAPGESTFVERWVPANFWRDTDSDGTPDFCITRANAGGTRGQSCMPLPSQGGRSCE